MVRSHEQGCGRGVCHHGEAVLDAPGNDVVGAGRDKASHADTLSTMASGEKFESLNSVIAILAGKRDAEEERRDRARVRCGGERASAGAGSASQQRRWTGSGAPPCHF